MDVTNPRHLDRLYRAVETSYRNLGSYRMSNRRLINSYAGTDFGRASMSMIGGKGPLPRVNLMHQTAEAYQVALAYNAPRFTFTSHEPSHRSFAKKLEIALRNVIRMIRLEVEFQPVILDAFFRIGVFKTLLPDSPRVQSESEPFMSPGLPYGARVGLDSWVHDTGVNDIRRAAYLGDMYNTMTMADAKEAFDKSFYNQLIPDTHESDDSYDKSESISRNLYEGRETDIDDMVRLADIFLPRESVILTVPCNGRFQVKSGAKPHIREWTGSENGPHHILTFADVPDNAMPHSIAENLFGLSELYNNLLMKSANRALKEKDIPWYTATAAEDMKRATFAKDMQPIRVDNKDGIGVMKMGGADSQLMLFDMNVLEIFNRSAGNLDMMLGLGPSAPTASQEQQLGQAVAGRQAEIRRRTNRFASSVGESLAEMIFDDPELTIPGQREVGNGYKVDATWYPSHLLERPGSIRDFPMEIEHSSMEYRLPQQRLQTMMQLNQAVLPLMPMLEQQGVSFNGQRFIEEIANLADSPRFLSLFQFNGLPPENPQQSAGVGGNQPREYVRHNVAGGATAQGRQHQQVQAMMNASNESE